ncbi:hypothetical protein STEG23_036093 [Scotinomys teguina]
MADRIVYTNSTLPSVPCECCYSASLPPATAPSSPRYYHVLYKQHPQAQMAWHGETYCLVGGYRLYGDAPLATPAKPEEEKPAPRRALKRKTFAEEPDQHLGCPLAKISRLTIIRDDKWAQDLGDPSTLLASQAKAEAPRRASKRKTVHEDSEQDLGCPRAKIPRLKVNHGAKWDHCLGCPCVPLATYAKAEEEKPAPRRALKRKRVQEESDIDLGCPRAKKPRLKIKRARKRGFQPSEINASILMKYMTTIGFTSVKAQTSTQKLACLIGVEGGHSLDNSLSVLRSFYQLETRYPMLTQICNTPWSPNCHPVLATFLFICLLFSPKVFGVYTYILCLRIILNSSSSQQLPGKNKALGVRAPRTQIEGRWLSRNPPYFQHHIEATEAIRFCGLDNYHVLKMVVGLPRPNSYFLLAELLDEAAPVVGAMEVSLSHNPSYGLCVLYHISFEEKTLAFRRLQIVH